MQLVNNQDIIDLSFRPTLVICVGEAGRAVGEQLTQLLAGMDSCRRACIKLLSVNGDTDAHRDLLGTWFEPASAAPMTLANLTLAALESILDRPTIDQIAKNGYTVPDSSVVIWVAAAAYESWLEKVARTIRTTLETRTKSSWVLLCLLNPYPVELPAHTQQMQACANQSWQSLLLSQNGTHALATFAYLFETHDEEGWLWSGRDDLPFAAAESIFFLTATSTFQTHEFQHSLLLDNLQVTDPFLRLGSLGASRLIFPRGHAERFCANQLGAAIMQQWTLGSSRAELSEEESNDLTRQADGIFKLHIVQPMEDDPALPRGGSLKRASPRLSMQAVTQMTGRKGLPPESEPIFGYFHPGTLHRMIGRRQDLPAALENQRGLARADYERWRQVVAETWDKQGGEVERTLTDRASTLVFEDHKGILRARAFVNEQRILLDKHRQELETLRGNRADDYERFLQERMGERFAGDWDAEIPVADASAQVGPGQWASPSRWNASNQPAAGQNAPSAGQTGNTQATPMQRSLQERVIERLAYRYRWFRRRQPSLSALAGALALTVPAATLLGQAILAGVGATSLPALVLLIAGLVLLGWLAGLVYRAYRGKLTKRAGEDLQEAYLRMYAQQCEQYEDLWRNALVFRFQVRVRRMSERLNDWEGFTQQIAKQLREDAQNTEQSLFKGTIGRRDILVANHQELSLDNYTLTDFERAVTYKRENNPISDAFWHGNHDSILRRLLDTLKSQTPLLEASSADLIAPIREFCLGVVSPYLEGGLVEVGAALAAMRENKLDNDLYERLLKRSVTLYQPTGVQPESRSFVGGMTEYLQYIQTPVERVVAVRTNDRDWLGTLRLLPGGGTPRFMMGGQNAQHTPPDEPPDWFQPDP